MCLELRHSSKALEQVDTSRIEDQSYWCPQAAQATQLRGVVMLYVNAQERNRIKAVAKLQALRPVLVAVSGPASSKVT